MPRRPRWDQPRGSPVQRRVRTGCRTCRERKVKCDEGRPRCQNCTKRGLACDNGMQLKWEQEFVSRGLAFGRQGRWAKHSSSGSSSHHNSNSGAASSLSTLASTLSVEETHWCVLPSVSAHHFINTLYSELEHAFQLRPRQQQHEEARADASTADTDQLAVVPPAAPRSPSADLGSRFTLLASPPSSSMVHRMDQLPHQDDPAMSTLSSPALPCYHTLSPYPLLTHLDASLFEYYLQRLCPLTTPSRRLPSERNQEKGALAEGQIYMADEPYG